MQKTGRPTAALVESAPESMAMKPRVYIPHNHVPPSPASTPAASTHELGLFVITDDLTYIYTDS